MQSPVKREENKGHKNQETQEPAEFCARVEYECQSHRQDNKTARHAQMVLAVDKGLIYHIDKHTNKDQNSSQPVAENDAQAREDVL